MTRLILLRHGRTEWNASGRVQGQTDVDLDETGVAQAQQAARHLATFPVDVIVSSDLRRALLTATALAESVRLEVDIDPRLRERDYGPWEGLLDAQIRERFPEDYLRWGTPTPFATPDIETIVDMGKRMAVALQDIADRVDGGTAVVVTHGGSARAGMAEMLGWPVEVISTMAVLGNCNYSELRHSEARGWRLAAYNVPTGIG